jgi:hypothetical protein
MAAIANAGLPVFASVEEIAVWAAELLVYLNPTLEIKTSDTDSQPYCTRSTGIAADGQTIFYATLIIPINADYNVATGKIWKKVKEIKSVTIPAAFNVN